MPIKFLVLGWGGVFLFFFWVRSADSNLIGAGIFWIWREKQTIKKNHIKEFGGRNARKCPKEKFGTSQGHPGCLGRFMLKSQFKGQNVCGTDGTYADTDGTCPWDRWDTHQEVSRRNSLCLLVFLLSPLKRGGKWDAGRNHTPSSLGIFLRVCKQWFPNGGSQVLRRKDPLFTLIWPTFPSILPRCTLFNLIFTAIKPLLDSRTTVWKPQFTESCFFFAVWSWVHQNRTSPFASDFSLQPWVSWGIPQWKSVFVRFTRRENRRSLVILNR